MNIYPNTQEKEKKREKSEKGREMQSIHVPNPNPNPNPDFYYIIVTNYMFQNKSRNMKMFLNTIQCFK